MRIDTRAKYPESFTRCVGSWPGAIDAQGATSLRLSILLLDIECAAKSEPQWATGYVDALDRTFTAPQWGGAAVQVAVSKMRLDVLRGDLPFAAIDGDHANWLAKRWDGSRAEQVDKIYWKMLPQPMRDVLAAHGGTIDDNATARPTDWKVDGETYLWVYRGSATDVVTYVFDRKTGKLLKRLRA